MLQTFKSKPIYLIALSLFILLTFQPSSAQAGPWTKSQGDYYVKIGENLFIADNYVDSTGQVIDGVNYSGFITSFYGEVGMGYGLQFVTYLPFTVASNSFPDGSGYSQVGSGDAIFGVQYALPFKTPLPLALRVDFKVPFYDITAVDHPAEPALGDGQVDITSWLSLGGSISTLPLYGFFEVGYRKRTELFVGGGDGREFFDGIAFYSQIGYTIKQRLLVALNVNGTLPFSQNEYTKSYITLGPSLYFPFFKGLAAEASFDPMIYAKNSAQGWGLTVGLSYKNN